MSSGITSELDSNQLAQLQRLLRLSFNLAEASLDIMQCTFQLAENNGADQTAQMRNLVCAFLFGCKKSGFFASKTII